MIHDVKILKSINKASELLLSGKIIIYPTDTLYGLGVDATNTLAIRNLNKLKNREQAYSIIVDSIDMLKKYAKINFEIEKKIKSMLPGSFTIILNQTKNNLSPLVSPNLNTIGIRIPKSEFILRVVKQIKKPIITTSVNIHGEQPLNEIKLINKRYNNINIFEDSHITKSKGSTIVDFSKNPFRVIRQGDEQISL